jgi:hypothetical protein
MWTTSVDAGKVRPVKGEVFGQGDLMTGVAERHQKVGSLERVTG